MAQSRISSMHLVLISLLATLVALAAGPAVAAGFADLPAGNYVEDSDHAYVMFNYEHLGFSTPYVRFREFDVAMAVNPKQPERSSIRVTIPVASVDSGVDRFDEHLVSGDWFDVAKHPEATFVSTGISLTGADTGTLNGNLTIKGITRPVSLNVRLNKAGTHPFSGKPWFGISASGLIKRSDWDLGKYAPNVTDEVQLLLEIEMQQAN